LKIYLKFHEIKHVIPWLITWVIEYDLASNFLFEVIAMLIGKFQTHLREISN